jgi:predicted Zn-dependent protease
MRPVTHSIAPALAAAVAFALGRVVLAQEAPKADPPPVTVGVPVTPAPLNLPDMGSGANAIISRNDEFQVGRMMVRNLRDENQILEDPEATEYIQSVGSRLGSEAQEGNQTFNFFFVRDKDVNAFALPGGFIGANTGLLLLTNNESELAGVLAHEIGHVVQRHIARAIQAQSRNSIPMMAAMLGAILIGVASGSPNAALGGISMAQGAAMQQQINFTRMEESEADRVGIGFLSAAEFDPSGMAAFFGAMGRSQGVSLNEIPDLLKSHPVTALRIAEARARASQLPARSSKKQDSVSYALIRERVRVLSADTDADLRPYYARVRANSGDSLALRYGTALADIKSGNAAKAVGALQTMVASNPEVTLLHTALGEAQMSAGQSEQALATFAKALGLFPRNVPVTVRYAEALMRADQPAKAHQLLLDLFNNTQPTPSQIRLTALAASSAGETGDAYYYMAEYHLSSGDLMLATQQLDLALTDPHLTDVQRKRYFARREEIRDHLREQRLQRGGLGNIGSGR